MQPSLGVAHHLPPQPGALTRDRDVVNPAAMAVMAGHDGSDDGARLVLADEHLAVTGVSAEGDVGCRIVIGHGELAGLPQVADLREILVAISADPQCGGLALSHVAPARPWHWVRPSPPAHRGGRPIRSTSRHRGRGPYGRGDEARDREPPQ